MSSRLVIDTRGRLVVEGVLLDLRGLRWVVVDVFELGFTRPGRPPTARERASAREPYESSAARRTSEHTEPPDELLDEAEAIRQALAEQRRQPPDLVNIAA